MPDARPLLSRLDHEDGTASFVVHLRRAGMDCASPPMTAECAEQIETLLHLAIREVLMGGKRG